MRNIYYVLTVWGQICYNKIMQIFFKNGSGTSFTDYRETSFNLKLYSRGWHRPGSCWSCKNVVV